MDATDLKLLPPAPERAEDGAVERCDLCGAPAEQNQRYCVVCGARRRHVHDPAARYLSAATGRVRTPAAGRRAAAGGAPRGNLLIALVLALIPIAVVLGMIVEHASSGGDAKLIAALQAQKAQVITTAGSPTSNPTFTAGAATAQLNSDFPIQRGYSIQLQTLPAGTDRATVSSAEAAARAGGAKHVGLIAQKDFHVKPSPPHGAYVIYSGAFTTKPAAEQALAGLKKRFPKAIVIQVQYVDAQSVAGAGKVLTQTHYGTATQVAGFHATQQQLAAGARVVKKIQQTEGKSYVSAQRGLPSQISVP